MKLYSWSKRYPYLHGAIIALLLVIALATRVEASSQPPEWQQSSSEGDVASLDDVQKAVVRLVAWGDFVLPENAEQHEQTRTATAFIYNALGYAYTNHHVVAGADKIQVYVDGETEARDANVIWSSVCDDLAIIDINGNGFSYLTWHDGEIAVGDKIYAAGFPLGGSHFTLSQGAIVHTASNGDTPWAALDSIIGHSAETYPGSSGGPLVNASGQVIGINFGGNLKTLESVAIPRAIVSAAQQRMVSGESHMTLGIAGEAMIFDDEHSGIWVTSLDAGSLAEQAGILPGDLLFTLDGEPLATDGSMRDYCEILQSHESSDILNIGVVRPQEEQVLIGSINGQALEALVATPSAPAADPPTSEAISSTVAIVTVERLNIRECAGLDCTVVGTALRNQCYRVNHQQQIGNITWLQIEDDSRSLTGWFAGSPYSEFATSCPIEAAPQENAPEEPAATESTDQAASTRETTTEDNATTETPAVETPTTEEPATEEPEPQEVTQEEVPTEEAPAEEPATEETADETNSTAETATEAEAAPPVNAIPNPDEACILFENWLGAEVTATFTHRDSGWNMTFAIPGMEQHIECFSAGRYTYTLDAPPPWNSINGEVKLTAGQHGRFPIRAAE